jgi:RNA polymerase sigma factor (sigma-70 family)
MQTELLSKATRATRPDGDDAWESLVNEYSPTLWAITKQYRLNDADSSDAVQVTWLRLLEHVDEIREPDRLAGWLATTVRRICIATGRAKRRQSDHDPVDLDYAHVRRERSEEGCPERAALRSEHVTLVQQALEELPAPQRRLIRLLMSSPTPSYRDVAAQLGVPIGSIGPTRARILARMRAALADLGLEDPVLG